MDVDLPARNNAIGNLCTESMLCRYGNVDADVRLRHYPYPYFAMLAFCSDLDETSDRSVYLETLRFLNTAHDTSMGPGIGLEVGNTIYFDMPPDQFAYWNTDDAGREMIRTLIRSGHIDCLHSYGDLATTRAHAGRALDELSRCNCRLEVWVDHAVAPTNFGSDIMRGSGDVPGAAAYHADLTCDFGVQFVWRGRVTSVIGQETFARLGGIYHENHPLMSARTLAKETAKRALAGFNSRKYRIHRANSVIQAARLRDGRPVFEFLRCNPHWGGVSSGDTAEGLGEVLSDRVLDRLVARRGVCVLYTHLGKARDPWQVLPEASVRSLRRLGERFRRGEILCTTTRRLLGYLASREAVRWRCVRSVDGLVIEVSSSATRSPGSDAGLADLAGLTFHVPANVACRVSVDGRPCATIRRNPADETGRASVSLPWAPLSFPDFR